MKHITALIGAPNSGKTTLYNWLTQSKFKTVNYPGATVEYSVGTSAAHLGEPSFQVVDTPGVYSLFPQSEDEQVTVNVLSKDLSFGRVNNAIVVVDGTQLSRHLMLVEQIKEVGIPFLIVVTMADLLRTNQIHFKKEVLESAFGAPVILFDGLLGGGLKEVASAVLTLPTNKTGQQPTHWSEATMAQKVVHLESVAKSSVPLSEKEKIKDIYKKTQQIDHYLLHPIFGLVLFFVVMTVLFTSIFWIAAPFQDLIDSGFATLAELIIQAGGESLITDFLANGVVLSFSAVLVFVPQIFILFVGIGLLESSGYLARAATLIDKPFSKIGLTGRSFVPVLSGFACAVPAIMATRNLSSKRDRWITNFIIPLMTCSARLPVYALLLSFLFLDQPAWKPGLMLAILYFAALIVGAISATILNVILAKAEHSHFMMELPLYRRPQWRTLLHQCFTRTQSYVKRAGPIIFVLAVIIWFGSNFPNYQSADKFETSYLTQTGHYIEPIFKPMGVDWRVGVGLLSAFAAREVFVSTMAVIFKIEGDESAQQEGLIKAMQEARFDTGELIFTTATVVGLIVFFMIALQCMSTVAIQIKESGSRKFALLQLALFNLVAYVAAVGAVHGLRMLGIA